MEDKDQCFMEKFIDTKWGFVIVIFMMLLFYVGVPLLMFGFN